MKTCPTCRRNYPDEYAFCLDDGATLSAPIDGEKTELVKGPYAGPSGETEQMPARYNEPASTVASPLPTLEAKAPRIDLSSGEPAGRNRTLWIASATVVLILAIGGGYMVAINGWSQRGGSPKPNVDPAPEATMTPSLSPTPDIPPTPDNVSLQSLVATGRVEAETIEEPITAQYKSGYVNNWHVKKGDLYQPCTHRSIAAFTNITDVDQINASPVEHEMSGDMSYLDAAIILSLDVKENERFYINQRLALLGKVVHLWVTAKAAPAEASRISPGTKAFFTESQTNRVAKGLVDSVNTKTGDIRIKLDDTGSFDQRQTGCLNVLPNQTGEVRFAISNMP